MIIIERMIKHPSLFSVLCMKHFCVISFDIEPHRNPAMAGEVQVRGGEPMAESRVRDSYVEENSYESRFGNSGEGRGRQEEPELSLIKLEGFEVIRQGEYDFEEPTKVSSSTSSSSSSSAAATTSMSSSTSVVTSSSKGFSPATNPLLTTSVFSEFGETTVPEIEEDVVTVQPSTAVEETILEGKEGDVEKEIDEEALDEIEKEGAGDNSVELSESDYFYSIYGDEYPFDYAEYINYSDEAFGESVISNGSPVKTFTVGQDSGKGKSYKLIHDGMNCP